MSSSKAFVFSLDAFVAFSLALIVIYTLIFFSTTPYGYYSSFMQAHYLAKDTLNALAHTQEIGPECIGGTCPYSKLDYISILSKDSKSAVKERVGPLIPNQFGYSFETSSDGDSWTVVYSTEDVTDQSKDPDHKIGPYRKLKASAQTISFGYLTGTQVFPENPYGYITCKGTATQCNDFPDDAIDYPLEESDVILVRLTVYT